MKRLEELGISPAPWKYISDSGYDRETGDFNTRDTVCDSARKVIVDWWNGETYGEICPNAEADARLISAAPEMYAVLWDLCFEESTTVNCAKCGGNDHGDGIEHCSKTCPLYKARAALAKAAGETEERND